jgi:hypothetical protein
VGTTYGLGIVDHMVEADASREAKLAALAAYARVAGVTLRDAFDGAAVEVTAAGEVSELEGALADELRAAVDEAGGSASYSSFKYLDGYVVCVEGAAEGEVELLDGDDGYVGPLDPLVETLDRLLEREGIDEACQALHRELRALCDRGRTLGLAVTLGA